MRPKSIVQKIENLQKLFSRFPSRVDLVRFQSAAGGCTKEHRTVKLHIWRNHSIEPILGLAAPYADFSGLNLQPWLSAYDDALTFAEADVSDIELFWLDTDRYHLQGAALAHWLIERIQERRQKSLSPFVVATWGDLSFWEVLNNAQSRIANCYFVDLYNLSSQLRVPLKENRVAKFSGTSINPQLHGCLARLIVCHWIGGVFLPPIKLIAVDLDNTLHKGVLGEDGVSGLLVEGLHRDLQEQLLGWRRSGVLLALVTRNEQDDVIKLLQSHRDYLLKEDHFLFISASWGPKSQALRRIAELSRVGYDSILFIDDNWGELAEVQENIPEMSLLPFLADNQSTLEALRYWPGLWRWRQDEMAGQREKDMQANILRQQILQQANDYSRVLQDLGVCLTIYREPFALIERLADLSARTNQFNLTLARLRETQLESFLNNPEYAVRAVHLKDRLSDSGVVALMAARRLNDVWCVIDLCISCRALGRGLEDAIIFGMARTLPRSSGSEEFLVFKSVTGPRNAPALSWLDRWRSKEHLDGMVSFTYSQVLNWNLPEGLDLCVQ